MSNNNMQPQPEGVLTDENGNKWEITRTGEGKMLLSNPPKHVDYYTITPHIERKLIFTDLCGNQVYKGDAFYFLNLKNIIEQHIAIEDHRKWLVPNVSDRLFLHRSDCEKWVASNIPVYTEQKALERALAEYYNFREQDANFDGIETFEKWIKAEIKEKCFTPKQYPDGN